MKLYEDFYNSWVFALPFNFFNFNNKNTNSRLSFSVCLVFHFFSFHNFNFSPDKAFFLLNLYFKNVKKIMRKAIIILVLLLFIRIAKAYTISGCSAITSPGEYYLTQNINNAPIVGSNACIDIQANNVLLDCQNYLVDGIDDGIGIKIIRTTYQTVNITIRNCRVNDFYYGIRVEEARNVSILNSEISSNYWYGIFFNDGANNATVVNTRVIGGNYYGIGYIDSNYGNFTNNSILNNGFVGVNFDGSSYNFFYNNTVKGHPEDGIRVLDTTNSIFTFNWILDNYEGMWVSGSSNNKFFNNFFNNSINVYPGGANFWNTTRQPGVRIFTNGTEIGGNFWATPSGNGYSQVCNDSNQDGFCDEPYVLNSNNIDYLPYSLYYAPPPPPPPYCMLINQSGTYYLTEDIINSEVDECIIINASNVVLDCQNHYIDGVDKEYSSGIEILKPNVVVRNCRLKDWHFGFNILEGSVQLSNNIVESLFLGVAFHTNSNLDVDGFYGYSIASGINSWGASHVNFRNCLLIGTNEDSGIALLSAYNWTIRNCSISGFIFGIEIHESENITITNISSFENYIGVGIEAGNTILANSTMYQNSGYGLYLGGTEGFYSWNVLIYNNLFNNTNNQLINQFSYSTDYPNQYLACKFNVTKTQGTNIIGNPYIGGNVWSTPSGTGFSDTCSDDNNDGICDSAYTLFTYSGYNWIDYLPLKSGAVVACQRFPPEVSIIPSSQTVQRLQTAQYSIRIKNNNTVECTPSIFYIENILCQESSCVVCTEYGCHPPVFPRIRTAELQPQEVKYYPINVTPNQIGNFTFSYRVYDSSTWYYTDASANIESLPIPCEHRNPSVDWVSVFLLPRNITRFREDNCGWIYIINNDYGDVCVPRNFSLIPICPSDLECFPSGNFTLAQGERKEIKICAKPKSVKNFTMAFKVLDPITQYYKIMSWNFTTHPCAVLDIPITYTLYADVSYNSTCFTILSPGVFLNCNNHQVVGPFGSVGIDSYENNVVIKNCILKQWENGIRIGGDNTSIENVMVVGYNKTDFKTMGIYGAGVSNLLMRRVRIIEYFYGFFGYNIKNSSISESEFLNNTNGFIVDMQSQNVSVRKNSFLNNAYHIRIWEGSTMVYVEGNLIEEGQVGVELWRNVFFTFGNFIVGNEIKKVSVGMILEKVYGNTIHSNIFTPYYNDVILVQAGPNSWNSTRGGNYWSFANRTGFSDTCRDADMNGICDDAYVLDENNIDYLPLARPVIPVAVAKVCQICDPTGMGLLAIVCIIVNILFCFPILILILIIIFVIYSFLKKYRGD